MPYLWGSDQLFGQCFLCAILYVNIDYYSSGGKIPVHLNRTIQPKILNNSGIKKVA